MKKRIITFVTVLCLISALLAPALTVNAMSDVSSVHWAREDISYLVGKGIINGYTDGTFRPENRITKAEYIAIINRTFSFTETVSINYPDVSPSKWYYNDIRKAEAAGYLFVFDGMVRPEDYITREEAAAMFGKLLEIANSTDAGFTDRNLISAWAYQYIGAVAEAGIIRGYTDGSFRPQNSITRAEVTRVISNTAGIIYNAAGTYVGNVDGNATITTPGVTLKNAQITGNLYISPSVSYGQVTLENTNVGGEIITIGSPKCTLLLKGTMNAVTTNLKGVVISVSGNIDELEVTSAYASTNVAVEQGASIGKLTMSAPGTVSGAGTVASAYIKSAGVIMTLRPSEWQILSGLSATINGNTETSSGSSEPQFVKGYPTAEITAASSMGGAVISLKAKIDRIGRIYYIVVPRGSAEPTSTQVKMMANYGVVTVAKAGYAPINIIDTEFSTQITDLLSAVTYDVWIVAEDGSGNIGTPKKLQPQLAVFADGYPSVYSSVGNAATVEIKTTRNATVFWAAVPVAITEIPTVTQIINKTTAAGVIYGSKLCTMGVVEYMTVTGLTGGVTAYNLYVTTVDGEGKTDPSSAMKVDMSGADNSVRANFSYAPTNGDYPVATTITLEFSKDMMSETSRTPLSFLGSSLKNYISISAVNAATGIEAEIGAYMLSAITNRTIAITPPAGGWPQTTAYTIKINGLVNESGVAPSPAEIKFSTTGTQGVVAAPVPSKTSGSSVMPGEKLILTCATPGANIIYTTDGIEVVKSMNRLKGSGVRTEVAVSPGAIPGFPLIVHAMAELNGQYSTEMVYTYVIEIATNAPTLRNVQGIDINNGDVINAGEKIVFHCRDSEAYIYYTLDGTTPHKGLAPIRPGDSIAARSTATDGKMTIKTIAIKYDSNNNPSASVAMTYVLTVVSGATAKPTAPTVFVSRTSGGSFLGLSQYTQYNSTEGTPLELGVGEIMSVSVTSANSPETTTYFYTTDMSDPKTSPTRREMPASVDLSRDSFSYFTVRDSFRYGQLRVIAYNMTYDENSTQSRYSDGVTIYLKMPA